MIHGQPEGYTSHFRDPKVFEKNSQLYAILGAQNENEMGRLLLYRSQDVVDWHFEGEIKTNLTQFGYMWSVLIILD